jgi:nucleotide-binding universal stress UspA family protein
MKTILVLTDFSINADYAAHYALKLAQKIEANLLLCNIYELPQGDNITDRKAWPLEACEQNSIQDLGELVARLKAQIDKDDKSLFRPEINQCSQSGAVIDHINEIARNNEAVMGVISRHDAGWLSTLLSGNHTRDIIESADFPILMIPYQVRFNNYKSIAFATAMNYTDITVLESLTGLAKHMNSEIVVTQVTDAFSDKNFELKELKHFFNQIPGKINYPKIRYHILENRTIINGLTWLANNVEIDLLVLVHRRRNWMQSFLSGSITQQFAVFFNKPLLIFPCYKVKEALTVF